MTLLAALLLVFSVWAFVQLKKRGQITWTYRQIMLWMVIGFFVCLGFAFIAIVIMAARGTI